jgi:hypothetical protein
MKLSTALYFRERVSVVQRDDNFSTQWYLHRAHLQDITDVMSKSIPAVSELAHVVTGLDLAVTDLDTILQKIMQYLDEQVESQRQCYIQQSHSIYEEDQARLRAIMGDPDKPMETYWQHRMSVIDEEKSMIKSRISIHHDWRVPGMILSPGSNDWIQHMVALDPLYLVDAHLDLLVHAVSRFNPVYQRRLRQYIYDERSNDILPGLPRRQLGFVFAHDFFSIKTLDIIERYLAVLFDLLRNGGTCIFTYVDGDRSVGADLVEKRMACFVPGQRIREICDRLGYETVFEYESPRGWNCCEVKRPGNIASLRGGQALATIVPIV